jgi:2-polyprenyl-3-methyl-5-hydroxy-6-metoxy-1,4-benzoquinol methylase
MPSFTFSGPAPTLAGRIRYALTAPGRERAVDYIQRVSPHLQRSDRILDIGSGVGFVADGLMHLGYNVTMLDVADQSVIPSRPSRVYDGETLPYNDDSFDVALLLTVLHHIPEPEHTIAEARRVARRIIIVEDIYETEHERRMTMLGDSWLNREFRGHPHSNRDDAGWRAAFKRLNLQVTFADQKLHRNGFFVFRHGLYVLDRKMDGQVRLESVV